MITAYVLLFRKRAKIVRGVTLAMFDAKIQVTEEGNPVVGAYVKLAYNGTTVEALTDSSGISYFEDIHVTPNGLLEIYVDIAGAWIPKLKLTEDWEDYIVAELRIVEDWEDVYVYEPQITEDWEDVITAELRVTEDWEEQFTATLRILEDWEELFVATLRVTEDWEE